MVFVSEKLTLHNIIDLVDGLVAGSKPKEFQNDITALKRNLE